MNNIQWDELPRNPMHEELVSVIRNKTCNTQSDLYFRVLTAYYMSQAASSMRCNLKTPHRGTLPCSMYALLLGTSGMGKGLALNIIEDEVFAGFTKQFMEVTLPRVAQLNIEKAAAQKATLNNIPYEEAYDKLQYEYEQCGEFLYMFDSGTTAAYRQQRTLTQIAGVGALNMVCDEIGSNILKHVELLDLNLEAYDKGKIKQKLLKSTVDNKRGETRTEGVPSNILCFGTPIRLFTGEKEEETFMKLLDSGYARRFMFGLGEKAGPTAASGAELMAMLTNKENDEICDKFNLLFTDLASISNYNKTITLPEDVATLNSDYLLACERSAEEFPVHAEMLRAEMAHRYFRALRLACVYAFMEGSDTVSMDNMYHAIRLVEDAGKAFGSILKRPKPYAQLATFITNAREDLTHADLSEALRFYPQTKKGQEEMLAMAVAWGYRNHCVIKRISADGIDFFRGDRLQEVDMTKLRVSYSANPDMGYTNTVASFDDLCGVASSHGFHLVNHHLLGGVRSEDNVIRGHDFFVLECVGEDDIQTLAMLLTGTKCFLYAVEEGKNHYRIIVPLKYHLRSDAKEYAEMMKNVMNSYPFNIIEATLSRSHAWGTSNTGICGTVEGECFDPTPFLPNTKRNTEREAADKKYTNPDRVQRHFTKQFDIGKVDALLNYGKYLHKRGVGLDEIITTLTEFNQTMTDPLHDNDMGDNVFSPLAMYVLGE